MKIQRGTEVHKFVFHGSHSCVCMCGDDGDMYARYVENVKRTLLEITSCAYVNVSRTDVVVLGEGRVTKKEAFSATC